MKTIWIFAEQNSNALHASYFELLGKAREIYPDAVLTAVLLDGGCAETEAALAESGANAVLHAAHEKLAAYQPEYYAMTLAELAKKHQPEIGRAHV